MKKISQKQIKDILTSRGFVLSFTGKRTRVCELHKNLRTNKIYKTEVAFSTQEKDWVFLVKLALDKNFK